MNFNLYDRSSSSQGKFKKLQIPEFYKLSSSNSDPKIGTSDSRLPSLENSIKSKNLSPQANVKPLFKSPDDSQYDIKLSFPIRPVTSKLSGLTLQENERFSIQNYTILTPRGKDNAFPSPSDSSLKLPSAKDFEKILNKLDMVSLSKITGQKRLMLVENESFNIILDKFNIQYCTIESQNKATPMTINIKRQKGKIITYFSKQNSLPSKNMCENYSTNDRFQINDCSFKFKNEYIYMAIEALTDTDFHLSIQFGKEIQKKKNFLLINKDEECTTHRKNTFMKEKEQNQFNGDYYQGSNDEYFSPAPLTERIKKSEGKNFIKINKSNSSKAKLTTGIFSPLHDE